MLDKQYDSLAYLPKETQTMTQVKEGDKAHAQWGGGNVGGKVVERKDDGELEIDTAGKKVSKKGEPGNAAVHLKRSGNDVVKKESELTKDADGGKEKKSDGKSDGEKEKKADKADKDDKADKAEKKDEKKDEKKSDSDNKKNGDKKTGDGKSEKTTEKKAEKKAEDKTEKKSEDKKDDAKAG